MQWIIWTIGSYKFKHFAYLSPFLHTQAHKKWIPSYGIHFFCIVSLFSLLNSSFL